MPKCRSYLSIKLCGSILLIVAGCGESANTPVEVVEVPAQESTDTPDLSAAIAKRMEGDSKQAVQLLRKLNEEFPNSSEILTQLGRSLFDIQNFPLAVFRFEQALSAGADDQLHRELAEAYLRSGDEKNAQIHFSKFLTSYPENDNIWLKNARLLAKAGKETEAINAFSRVPDLCDYKDSLTLADLFFKKALYTQSARWFRESAKREESVSPAPLLGLIRVSLAKKNENEAESLALALEKTHPDSLELSDLNQQISELLIRRRLADLLDAGISTNEASASVLAQALLNQNSPVNDDIVVASGPKLPPDRSMDRSGSTIDLPAVEPDIPSNSTESNLADAFSAPISGAIELSALEKSREAYLNSNYTEALYQAREAIKSNSSDAEAWRLSSQAHFQLGEEREAEMTILEAIRHNPFDLGTRLDYLRIARETLRPKLYLVELEKAKELFPDSTEILWELARRYHLVEKMPVTAGILYRQLLNLAPAGSGLHEQAKMELLKLQEL